MIDLKKFVQSCNKKPVLVYGLGKSGLSTLKALRAAGAEVVVGDDKPLNLELLKQLGAVPLDLEKEDLSRFSYLILSPGVPFTHPEPHQIVKAASLAGLEIIGDIEIFYKSGYSCKTVGVTGTNGKSTTSALIHHILTENNRLACLGGNIGIPVLDLDFHDKSEIVVLEISSYQIDLMRSFRPEIAVILNARPDHLDRHGSLENYIKIKESLADPVEKPEVLGGVAIIGTDDETTIEICRSLKRKGLRRTIPIAGSHSQTEGVFVIDGILHDHIAEEDIEVGRLIEVQALKGTHNYQNIAAAYAVCKILGLEPQQIFAGIKTFSGLQHRQFLVRTINGVSYVNDSKATNADATGMALACHENIYWIAGGRKKETGLDGLEIFADRIRHTFLIGEAADDFAEWLTFYGFPFIKCATLENALAQAHKMAQEHRGQPGGAGVVLLSPACASFDQFSSFEERGTIFTNIVNSLSEEVSQI